MKSIYIPITMPPQNIAFCKYYIEAEDNIGYLRVLDSHIALLHAITTEHQEDIFLSFLQDIAPELSIQFLPTVQVSRR